VVTGVREILADMVARVATLADMMPRLLVVAEPLATLSAILASLQILVTEAAKAAPQEDMASDRLAMVAMEAVKMVAMGAVTMARTGATGATETKEMALMLGICLATWLKMVTEAIPILVTPAMVAMEGETAEVTPAMVAMEEETVEVTPAMVAMEEEMVEMAMVLERTEMATPATEMVAIKMACLAMAAAKTVAIPDSTEDTENVPLTLDPVTEEAPMAEFKPVGLLQAGKS